MILIVSMTLSESSLIANNFAICLHLSGLANARNSASNVTNSIRMTLPFLGLQLLSALLIIESL